MEKHTVFLWKRAPPVRRTLTYKNEYESNRQELCSVVRSSVCVRASHTLKVNSNMRWELALYLTDTLAQILVLISYRARVGRARWQLLRAAGCGLRAACCGENATVKMSLLVVAPLPRMSNPS